MLKFLYGLMTVLLMGLVANVGFAQEEAAPAAEEQAAPVVDEAAEAAEEAAPVEEAAPAEEAAEAQEKLDVAEEPVPVEEEEEAVAEAEVEVTVESGCCEEEVPSCCEDPCDPCGGTATATAAPRRGPIRRVLSMAVRIVTLGRRGV